MISNFDDNFYNLYKKYKNKYINLKNNILEGGYNNEVDQIFYYKINEKVYNQNYIERYNSFIKSSILKDDIKQKLYYKEKVFNEIKYNIIKKEYKKINFFNKKQLILDAIEIIITNKSSKSELSRIYNKIIIIINNLNDFMNQKLFDVIIVISNLEKIKNIPENKIQISDITDKLINELNNIKNILKNNILEGGYNNEVDEIFYNLINKKVNNQNDIERYNNFIKSSILKDNIKQKLYYKEKEFQEIKKEYARINFFNTKQIILEAIEIIITNKLSESELLKIRYKIITIINNLNDLVRKQLFDVKININNLEKFKNISEYKMQISDITDELINELNNIKNILENNISQSTTNVKTLNKTNCTNDDCFHFKKNS